jgi:glucose-6-phosphate isomerase
MTLHYSPAWNQVQQHAERLASLHLRQLFAENPQRFADFSLQHEGLLIDISKQRLDQVALDSLYQLATSSDMAGWQQRMLQGETINHTEQRAVRHTDLRAGATAPQEVQQVLAQMAEFCESVHSGAWRGFDGERITDVVNLGIGGSDLGPKMAARALAAFSQPDITVHFVSNIDGAHLAGILSKLNPRTTLFIVASKTFTTQETMTNAASARDWLLAAAGADPQRAIARHFVAVSTNIPAVLNFGIEARNIFAFWDWVGGRFSLWSAIGLPLALAIGFQNFLALLEGARNMDDHFFAAPFERNLPLTLALLTLWNTNFLNADTHAVLPYSHSFQLLPAYLQQLEMESNGKEINRDGLPITVATSPILWGEAGTSGQHSFYQLLHQGGRIIPCDFIALANADFPLPGHHAQLLANCLAQSAALAFGQTEDEAREAGTPDALLPYKVFDGNQPSTTLLINRLTPYILGQLLAMYEHKVFALGVLWELNSFDQWGVELGKTLAHKIQPLLETDVCMTANCDGSTQGLVNWLRQHGHC